VSHEWHRLDDDKKTGERDIIISRQRPFMVVVAVTAPTGRTIELNLRLTACLVTVRHELLSEMASDERCPLLLNPAKSPGRSLPPAEPVEIVLNMDRTAGTATFFLRLGENATSERCGKDRPLLHLLFQPAAAVADDLLKVQAALRALEGGREPPFLELPYCRSAPFYAITRLRLLETKKHVWPKEHFETYEQKLEYFRRLPDAAPPSSASVVDGAPPLVHPAARCPPWPPSSGKRKADSLLPESCLADSLARMETLATQLRGENKALEQRLFEQRVKQEAHVEERVSAAVAVAAAGLEERLREQMEAKTRRMEDKWAAQLKEAILRMRAPPTFPCAAAPLAVRTTPSICKLASPDEPYAFPRTVAPHVVRTAPAICKLATPDKPILKRLRSAVA